MALVLIAHLFLTKERLALRDTHRLLSCLDVVDMLRHKLPAKIISDVYLLVRVYAAGLEAIHRPSPRKVVFISLDPCEMNLIFLLDGAANFCFFLVTILVLHTDS